MQMVDEYCSYMFPPVFTSYDSKEEKTGLTNIQCETIKMI
jgi:hypothetical protein